MRHSKDQHPTPDEPAGAGGQGGRRISRAAFLTGAAGAVAGGGTLLGGLGSGPARANTGAGTGQAKANGPKAAAALDVSMVKDLTGPGLTSDFQMAATDLGVPARTPDDRLLFVFGDTWADVPLGTDWRSPVALYSETTDLNRGIAWSEAVGGTRARQLWDYDHGNPEFDTVLPSDVITIGDTMYLHVAVQNPYPNVVWTELWRSRDSGQTWEHTGARWGREGDPGLDPLFQMLTYGHGDNGWLYVYSTKFDRSGPVIMHRVREDQIDQPTAYEPWGFKDGQWSWGTWGDPVSPILEGRFGELSLRPLGGKWLFTCLNLDAAAIEGRIVDTPESDLTAAPVHRLIEGVPWPENDPQTGRVAQAYGGYIIPGSTLDDLHLSVSQWENPDQEDPPGWHYHVMQHRIRGLPA